MTDRIEADVLVVGSGPGGAVSAALLAEGGRSVVVAEEGPWHAQGTFAPFSLEEMAQQYRNAGLTAALGVPAVAYAEGSCVGGGSEVNSGLFHRVPRPVLDEWRSDFGLLDLDDDHLGRYFDQVEAGVGVEAWDAVSSPASEVLARGGARLGWEVQSVPRWASPRADGSPRRHSMSETYLPRATAAGAKVIPSLRVDELTHRGGTVTGAVCTDGDGRRVTVEAPTVFVCAGAVHTSALLQRSRLPAGGRQFLCHPTVKVVARFDEPLGAALDIPHHQVKEFGPDLSFGGSASRPGYVALALADGGDVPRDVMADAERCAVYYAAIRGRGRGRVLARRGVVEPLVLYYLTRRDIALLATGLGRLCLLLLRAGARELHPAIAGAPVVHSEADLPGVVAAVRRSTARVMSVHLFSSLPAGERAERCPVDSYGRYRGLRGVLINDASVLPTAPGVNPQGTIMALAARAADRFLEDSP